MNCNRCPIIRKIFVNSKALGMTQKTVLYYIDQAKHGLDELENSDYKRSLDNLTDYIAEKTF